MVDVSEYEDRVSRPGKFEGESGYVPYYWENGMADDEIYSGDTPIWVFKVTPEDRAMFPELGRRKVIKLWESNDGFVQEW